MTNLERIRHEKGLSQHELVMLSGVEQCRISGFERMRNNIDNSRIETITKLANALDVYAWEILNDKSLSEMLKNTTMCNENIIHDPFFDGSKVKEVRRIMKMTQGELAQETFIGQGKISLLEKEGADNARIETLCTLCISLSCNVWDLIEDDIISAEVKKALTRGVL